LPLIPRPYRRRPYLAALLIALLFGAATPAAQVERVIYASVLDKDGSPVSNLTVDDFIVREDGQAREVLRVARDTDPLQIALLVDNSAAMRERVTHVRKSAAAFVDATREGVQISLVTLAERPTVAVGYTADRAPLHKAIGNIFAFSAGNYLLDGIAETAQALSKRTLWRSVIVVLTGFGHEMSYRPYTEVLRFFRASGASLHVLQLGADVGARGREIVLSTGTSETGGRFEHVLSVTGLEAKAKQLGAEISHQYRVVYSRPPRLITPEHAEVSVKRRDLRARGMLMKTEADK
jgi:Ca-activated chloride channel family protein